MALLLPFALALLLAARPAAAAPQEDRPEDRPEDVPGWEAARWGMTEAELAEAFGDRLATLPGRWEFGGAYADRAIFDVTLGDLDFTAFFQMNDRTRRLQQVLLERRNRQATPRAYGAVLAALEAAYGAPDRDCVTPRGEGGPIIAELSWSFPTTTIHATFLDFRTSNLLYENPDTWADPLANHLRNRLIFRNALPRRVLVRFHDSTRTDLLSRTRCPD